MLPNERFALQRRAYYESIGLVVDATNGEFAHSPLTRKECNTGYYLLHDDHQHHGLLQSRDLGKCCFFAGDVKRWLLTCDFFPDNYFELWEVYEEFVGTAMNTPGSVEKRKKTQKERNTQSRAGKAGAKVQMEQRIGIFGFSLEQKSERGRKGGKIGGTKGGTVTGSQVWESTVDGYRSTASGVVRHNKHNGWAPESRIRIK